MLLLGAHRGEVVGEAVVGQVCEGVTQGGELPVQHRQHSGGVVGAVHQVVQPGRGGGRVARENGARCTREQGQPRTAAAGTAPATRSPEVAVRDAGGGSVLVPGGQVCLQPRVQRQHLGHGRLPLQASAHGGAGGASNQAGGARAGGWPPMQPCWRAVGYVPLLFERGPQQSNSPSHLRHALKVLLPPAPHLAPVVACGLAIGAQPHLARGHAVQGGQRAGHGAVHRCALQPRGEAGGRVSCVGGWVNGRARRVRRHMRASEGWGGVRGAAPNTRAPGRGACRGGWGPRRCTPSHAPSDKRVCPAPRRPHRLPPGCGRVWQQEGACWVEAWRGGRKEGAGAGAGAERLAAWGRAAPPGGHAPAWAQGQGWTAGPPALGPPAPQRGQSGGCAQAAACGAPMPPQTQPSPGRWGCSGRAQTAAPPHAPRRAGRWAARRAGSLPAPPARKAGACSRPSGAAWRRSPPLPALAYEPASPPRNHRTSSSASCGGGGTSAAVVSSTMAPVVACSTVLRVSAAQSVVVGGGAGGQGPQAGRGSCLCAAAHARACNVAAARRAPASERLQVGRFKFKESRAVLDNTYAWCTRATGRESGSQPRWSPSAPAAAAAATPTAAPPVAAATPAAPGCHPRRAARRCRIVSLRATCQRVWGTDPPARARGSEHVCKERSEGVAQARPAALPYQKLYS